MTKTVEPVTLGERLRARRLELGLSATLIARHAGTNRGTLYRIERGRHTPTLNLEGRLREVLDLDGSR